MALKKIIPERKTLMEVFYNKFRVAPFELLLRKPGIYFQKVITAGKPLLLK